MEIVCKRTGLQANDVDLVGPEFQLVDQPGQAH